MDSGGRRPGQKHSSAALWRHDCWNVKGLHSKTGVLEKGERDGAFRSCQSFLLVCEHSVDHTPTSILQIGSETRFTTTDMNTT